MDHDNGRPGALDLHVRRDDFRFDQLSTVARGGVPDFRANNPPIGKQCGSSHKDRGNTPSRQTRPTQRSHDYCPVARNRTVTLIARSGSAEVKGATAFMGAALAWSSRSVE